MQIIHLFSWYRHVFISLVTLQLPGNPLLNLQRLSLWTLPGAPISHTLTFINVIYTYQRQQDLANTRLHQALLTYVQHFYVIDAAEAKYSSIGRVHLMIKKVSPLSCKKLLDFGVYVRALVYFSLSICLICLFHLLY